MFDVVKTVRPVVENFGDDEGSFPSRGELVWFLLIHSKNQAPLLKGSTPHVSGVESTQVLLIDGRPDQGHLSFFFQVINCVLPGLFCFLLREKLDSGCVVKQVTW